MRLPRKRRLTNWGDFRKVRERGKSFVANNLVLGVYWSADPEVATSKDRSNLARFGFVTSKKVGNAVTRNRVRRRLRSIVREHGDELIGGEQAGLRIVTIARFRAGTANQEILRREWRFLAAKAGLLPRGKPRASTRAKNSTTSDR